MNMSIQRERERSTYTLSVQEYMRKDAVLYIDMFVTSARSQSSTEL